MEMGLRQSKVYFYVGGGDQYWLFKINVTSQNVLMEFKHRVAVTACVCDG